MRVERAAAGVSPRRIQSGLSLRQSYDLALLAGLAPLLPMLLLLPIPWLRVPLGLIAALLAPGYTLTAALFPRRGDVDAAARIGLSFGLSIPVLPVLALLLDALPWGIRPWPMAMSLSFWILLLCGLALWRRQAPAAQGQAYLPPQVKWAERWRSLGHRGRTRYAIGTLVLAGALLVSREVFTALLHDSSGQLTEFYILGAEGWAERYPRTVAPGEEMQVRAGIVNREGVTTRYRVEVRWQGQVLVKLSPVTLAAGRTWEAPLRFALAQAGDDQPIDVLLFQKEASTPYRQLRLWVDVRPAP